MFIFLKFVQGLFNAEIIKCDDKKSKRLRRVDNHDAEDRICYLLNSISCQIFSYIPTTYAVVISILFLRWKLVQTSLHNLCFDDRLCLRPATLTNIAVAGFEQFVYIVLLQSQPVDIDKFSLHCSRLTALSIFNFWVSSIVIHNVRQIELGLGSQCCIELPKQYLHFQNT